MAAHDNSDDLTTNNQNILPVTGILLAGGNSSRMQADKGLVEIAGKKMVEIAIDHLSACCSEIIISSNNPDYEQFGFRVANDLVPNIGPMGGIYSALKISSNIVNLLLSVDLPFVNAGLLRYLIRHLDKHEAAVPWHGDEHYEPLCACYNLELLRKIETSIVANNYKLPDLFNTIDIHKLIIDSKLPFYHPHLFFNVNSRNDLREAELLQHLL